MIYGNLNQQKILRDLIENNYSPILVSGPEGIGKFSFCLEYLQQKSFEKIVISPSDKVLKIESARFLSSLAQRKTEKRVIVVNEAHKFKIESQNSLLKTLEESMSNTIFILITHQENKILPTIRSRSLKVKFTLVPKSETIKFLQTKGFNDEDISLALDFYPYQPGKALQFLIQKNKFEVFKNFLTGDFTNSLKDNFSLKEFLEYYLLVRRKEFLASLAKNQSKNQKLDFLKNLRSALDLYYDADYNLNFDLQLINLVLNNG